MIIIIGLLILNMISPNFCQSIIMNLESKYYSDLDYLELKSERIIKSFVNPMPQNLLQDFKIVHVDTVEPKPTDSESLLRKNNFLKEIDGIFYPQTDESTFFAFYYSDSAFSLMANPKISLDYQFFDKKYNKKTYGGVELYGNYKDIIYFLSFEDNQIIGEEIDEILYPNSQKGFQKLKNTKQGYEFGNVDSYVGYSWDNGNFLIGKMNFTIGYDNINQIILSDRSPSSPFINLNLRLTEWLHFNYFHFWLNSGITDSTTIRENSVRGRFTFDRRKKFLATHSISILPLPNLEFSIGESVVYSDNLEVVYFLPIMFYRLADHYLMGGDGGADSGDNAQLFAGVKYLSHQINLSIYANLFVDEFSSGVLWGDDNAPASIAYSFGVSFLNPFWVNNYFNVEYSRLNPFIYMNSNSVQTYSSSGYDLGHWIGSNGDIITINNRQFISKQISATTFFQSLRKGNKELVVEQYSLPYPDFLYGKRYSRTNYGIELNYNYFSNLSFVLKFEKIKQSGHFSEKLIFVDENISHFQIALKFGLF